MTDREVKLVFGSLLHDAGKVIYREGTDRRKHSQSGYDFLKEEVGIKEIEVLNCVKYHHADAMKTANLDDNSLAYIVYIADNIASAADRRQKETEDTGFEISMPLQSVFNILNRNHQQMYYEPKMLDIEEDINYPGMEKKKFDEQFYAKVKLHLLENLRGLEWTQEYINSLLEVLEANLIYVPSSTSKSEVADISLFDHLKLTAAVGSCILQYMEEKEIADYRKELFEESASFYEKEVFWLFSIDLSGIQDFIYTITSKNALKTLRARSFYLEIMMEHIIDCLLEELHLSRANIIYTGGGHCYILMPNTDKANMVVEAYMNKLNQWLMDMFQISLYAAWGYAVCSANGLKNMPQGSYTKIFKQISDTISKRKSHKYSAAEIIAFNKIRYGDYTRECKVCRKIAKVDDEGVCATCRAIEKFSGNILYDDFFTITLEKNEKALPLPGGYYLTADNEESLKTKMQHDDYFVRAYGKNRMFTGKHISTKLWVGDYTTGKTFAQFADEAAGIDRIGIIRADVDNLGQAFVSGFENPDNENRYVTLSRTATLSRQLSMFFKLYVNKILAESTYLIDDRESSSRNATICYSGGDDLFIVGAWNDIIELAVDIQRKFERYTQGTLTISAGIGIYEAGYPISAIAGEVADLEESAKAVPEKNAVTLFQEKEGTYRWKEFEDCVIKEKYKAVYDFFTTSEERGKNFLYQLLELLRNRTDKINFARYVYILSRLEPDRSAALEQREAYKVFSQKMYQWIKNDEDCRQLITAIYLYVYLTREKEETVNESE